MVLPGVVAGFVTQATGTLEFEDGLRTGILPESCPCGGCIYLRINSKPRWGAGWFWFGCVCHKDPTSDQIPILPVPRMGGIRSQLLCGVRIELVVGSLHSPR